MLAHSQKRERRHVQFASQFHHQFARSCTRSMTNPMQTIFKSLCKRTVVSKCFIRGKPYPCQNRFYGSQISPLSAPESRETVTRWPRTTGKTSGAISRLISRNFPAMAGQWQRQWPRLSIERTQDNLPCAGCERAMSAPELARRLASNLNHDIQKLWTRQLHQRPISNRSQGGSRVPANSHRVPFTS